MDSDLTGPLAKVIYEAHARSRNLKTRFQDLGNERAHWINVATAVLAFWGECAIDEEESES